MVALASPAFSQSFDPDVGSGNIVPPAAQYTPGYGYGQATPANRRAAQAPTSAFGAYAQEPAWNGLPEGSVVPDQSGRRFRSNVRR